MVATFLQEDLVEELKKILQGFRLKNPYGESCEINIFSQNLPVPESLEQTDIPIEQLENGLIEDITMKEPYPYIIVRIEDGEIKDESSAQIVSVLLLIGIYDNAYEKQGYKDVLNIIQKIYERFAKMPVLNGKYTIQYPIVWTLQEEETYPFYFGGMNLDWEVAAVRRECEFS